MSLKNVFRFRESTSTPKGNSGSATQDRAGMVSAPLFQSLPQDMQEQVFLNLHLWSYLENLQSNGLDIPEFVSRLNKSFKGNASNNLIYPVANKVFVHIYTAEGEARDIYVPIEPSSGGVTARLMEDVDQKLIDHVSELQSVVGEEQEKRIEVLTSILEKICDTGGNGKSRSTLKVTPEELDELKYLMIRDKEGMGAIQPLVSDPYIEDVSCSGVGAVFIEHKIFGGLTSSITFDTTQVLDQFVIKLSEKIGRPVTVRNPIVDSTLPDGSRINIVYGDDVSKRGSNFTIRKFQATPFSILDLVNSGTLSFEMASYLSLMLGAGMNTFVSGETASGKTTMLNAISTFIPPASKIVSIEDTPELQVPHPNWTREVVRNTVDGSSSVTMFDLLRAALRQRPNEIIIGEIRGEEGAIAFQAMQTGHSCMATFHASSVERLIQRMTGHPINVPKTYIDNLNLVIIMSAVRLPDGSTGRRILSINEVIEYDTETDSFGFIEVFRWDAATDTFEYPGFMNTNLLENVVTERRGMPPLEHRQIYTMLEERATILRNLAEQDITNFYELHNVITQANREGLFR
ncbi:MAG TPA: secretion system protein E [Dehalococcoidia bacterium]|nr:secretion system protein E [Dehalococcoidia bacterium]